MDSRAPFDSEGGAPAAFELGGQRAFAHDPGFAAGIVHTFDALDGGRETAPHKVHVLVPRRYRSGGAYPVLYLNDGHTVFWPGGVAGQSWRVPECLAALYAEDAIPELLVVAIEPRDRRFEYTHTAQSDAHPGGGLEAYGDYVAHAVAPFIAAHYATRREAAATAIAGSSHGGLAAFYIANRHPERFGLGGCFSPSFWVGLDPVHGGALPGGPLARSALVSALAPTLADRALRPRLWIDWGMVRSGGAHNHAIEAAAARRGAEMVALLCDSYGYAPGSELMWLEDPEGEHDERSWARRLPLALRALFSPRARP